MSQIRYRTWMICLVVAQIFFAMGAAADGTLRGILIGLGGGLTGFAIVMMFGKFVARSNQT